MLHALESGLLSLKITSKTEPILHFYKLWHLLKPFGALGQFQRTFWEILINIRNSYKILEIKGLITVFIASNRGYKVNLAHDLEELGRLFESFPLDY